MTFSSPRATSRQQFLRASGGAVLASLAAVRPTLADAAPPIRLGSGAHTYDCIHDWLTPPPNLFWGDTHGVAQDRAGRIYIAHTVHPDSPSPDAIVVFDKNGKFVTSWGARFRGGAHGLDIRREGKTEYLYHCDIKNALVVKTTLDGAIVWEKGAPVEAGVYDAAHKFTPTNVALSPHDNGFYVADGYGSSYIHQYNDKAEWVRTFGGPGSAPGQTSTPHGLFIDDRNNGEPLLVVADRGNRRLQYFTTDGKHIGFVTEGMRQPCHFDRRGDELLVPDLDSVVTILDKNNKVAAQIGDGSPSDLRGKPRSQYLPGKFIHPHSAKFLNNGDILVVEWVPTGRVTLLRKVKA